jgi:hypothetical protein
LAIERDALTLKRRRAPEQSGERVDGAASADAGEQERGAR